VKGTAVIYDALAGLFEHLDAERWDSLAARLHEDVQLADEVTADWLRGRERVAAYLRAQTGIVTHVRSDVRPGESRWLTEEIGVVTFVDHARYRLEGVEQRVDLTGTALFNFEEGDWRLLLFHLGARSMPQTGEGDAAPPPQAAPAPAEPGLALRRHRKRARLSLRALAARTGVSASFLSQVERGVAEPSVSTLVRIAQALDLPVGALLDERLPARPAGERVVRRAFRRRVTVPAGGAELELLTDEAAAGGLEVSIVTVAPGAAREPAVLRTEPGERFVHVVAGALRLTVGAEEVVLDPGDSFTVPPGEPYALANASSEPLRYVAALARQGPSRPSSPIERSIE
jgi:transcriptional regulator with XRE-family HTH domain